MDSRPNDLLIRIARSLVLASRAQSSPTRSCFRGEHTMRKVTTLFLSSVLAVALAACGGGGKKAKTTGEGQGPVTTGGGGAAGGTEPSLYTRLGELPAITSVVDKFLGYVVADDRINARFQ